MYIVPILVAVDADDAIAARTRVDDALREHALHVDAARRLSPRAAQSPPFTCSSTPTASSSRPPGGPA